MPAKTSSDAILSQTSGQRATTSMVVFLRIAAILALVQYGAHAFLFLTRSLGHAPGPIASIAASPIHSYWDFYFGYGLIAILSGVVEVILLWQLASMAKRDRQGVRPVVALFIFANLAHALVVWRYFALPAPIIFDVVIATLLAFALIMSQRTQIETRL